MHSCYVYAQDAFKLSQARSLLKHDAGSFRALAALRVEPQELTEEKWDKLQHYLRQQGFVSPDTSLPYPQSSQNLVIPLAELINNPEEVGSAVAYINRWPGTYPAVTLYYADQYVSSDQSMGERIKEKLERVFGGDAFEVFEYGMGGSPMNRAYGYTVERDQSEDEKQPVRVARVEEARQQPEIDQQPARTG